MQSLCKGCAGDSLQSVFGAPMKGKESEPFDVVVQLVEGFSWLLTTISNPYMKWKPNGTFAKSKR